MNLNNARFVASATQESQYPKRELSEIAFVGRSNVGKSSLINALCKRKNLARTSSSPGRTQTINFYEVDSKCYFVDLPGYGFARVPKKVRAKWGPMIEHYLRHRTQLAGVVLLVDARHEPTSLDQMMVNWVRTFQKPMVVVATKADKVKSSKRVKTFRQIEAVTGPFIAFSAVTGMGKSEVVRAINSLLDESENGRASSL